MHYISLSNLAVFLRKLKEHYDVYVPVKKGEQRFYEKYTELGTRMVIGEVRAYEPLKSFFSRARERVADDFSQEVPAGPQKPFCIVGVKACDLKGFRIQDHVFKDHDSQDPFYMRSRKDNLIISADCTCAISTCFCLALGEKPYPTKDFDINLSQVDEGFLVETGSARGKSLIEKYSSFFEKAPGYTLAEYKAQRERVIREVEENIRTNRIPDSALFENIITRNYESALWQEEARTCVECGACTVICPTCHCFLLYDQKDESAMARLRVWDSCMIKDYARVAGGANPRKKLWMRLRNRFEKKFDFFPKVASIYACTGCGRCISACPAKIDIRKVLKRLVDNV
jgi:sulfhydrogenase subunit beta (sulfur reductase)